MRKVIGIGETTFDIIFKDNKPINAVPGGSAFNAIISLGRSGIDTTFIGETGNDRVGKAVIDFLHDNDVHTEHVNCYPDSKSSLSLAFLDEHNNADYLFYKSDPHDQFDFTYPEINRDDIVLFSSFFAINPIVRPQMLAFLEHAHSRGAILYYDVNYRASHRNEVMRITPNLIENLEFADIVRGSNEDFEVIYKLNDADKVYHSEISFYCKNFICTRGKDPISVHAEGNFHKDYDIESLKTVSTIGAGDTFNAGFIYGLLRQHITRDDIQNGLTEAQWDSLIASGKAFSAECCKDIYNYVGKEFGLLKKQEL